MPFVQNFSSEYGNIHLSMDKNLKLRPIAHRTAATTVQISKPGDIVIRFSTDRSWNFDFDDCICVRQVRLTPTGHITGSTDKVDPDLIQRLQVAHPWLEAFVANALTKSMVNTLPVERFPLNRDIQYTKQLKILRAFLCRHEIDDVDPMWFMDTYPNFDQTYQHLREWADVYKGMHPSRMRECMGRASTGIKHLAWYGIPKTERSKAVRLAFQPITVVHYDDPLDERYGGKEFTPGTTGLPDWQDYSHFIRIQWLEFPHVDGKIVGESIDFIKNVVQE